MLAFAAQRILASVPVVLVVLAFVFLLLHLTPGDPAAVIAGAYAKAADIERIRHQLGLDRSLLAQFWTWASQLLRGDLGVSIFTQRPVTELIGQRLEPTIALAITTMLPTIT